jgi:hypothetical protein
MEKVPLTFSRALCMRTSPDLRTATIMSRGFFASGFAVGGGGDDGYAASSMILMCVMYDSRTVQQKVSGCTAQTVAWPPEYLTRAVLVPLAEAAINDPPLLIFKYLGSSHTPIAPNATVDPARSVLK